MMRIITGSARGVRLDTLPGEQTRPTAERTKEAIFSMLQFGLEGRRVLDLFTGSGQLGLEAVSRGAASAVLVDASREALAVATRNAERTKLADRVRLVRSDALSYLKGEKSPFHLVFLDPPYAAGLVPQALRTLLFCRLLTPGAIVVCETAEAADVFGADADLAAAFTTLRQNRYGAATVTLLCPAQEEL